MLLRLVERGINVTLNGVTEDKVAPAPATTPTPPPAVQTTTEPATATSAPEPVQPPNNNDLAPIPHLPEVEKYEEYEIDFDVLKPTP